MTSKPSMGGGHRATLSDASGPVVSIWAHTEQDAEYMAHEGNMRHMEAMEEHNAQLAREAERQLWAEHRKIRARA